MNSSRPVKRAYRSDVRAARASSTRVSIIRAATELFVRDGFGTVSVDDIAEEAGVSRATVFNAVGGKAAVLRAAYDVAIVGDDEPVPLPERPWARPVREAPDAPTLLARYAHLVTTVGSRVADVYEVMRGAASAHPDVKRHWDSIRAERHAGAGRIVAMVAERGGLRGRLSRRAATDIVFVLNDPGLYYQLVTEHSWTRPAFERWLARTFHAQLL